MCITRKRILSSVSGRAFDPADLDSILCQDFVYLYIRIIRYDKNLYVFDSILDTLHGVREGGLLLENARIHHLARFAYRCQLKNSARTS